MGEKEDRLMNGWFVRPFDEVYNVEADVVVSDLRGSMEGEELEQYKKALEKLKEKMEEVAKDLKEKAERKASVEESGTAATNAPAPAPAPAAPPEEKEPDFDQYCEIFSKPDLTDEEEKTHLFKLIKEKRKILVKQLVFKMAETGTGKSAIFKSLAKQYNVKPKEVAAENGEKAEEKKENI